MLILATKKIGNLSNDEGDGNKKLKKVADFQGVLNISKTGCLS